MKSETYFKFKLKNPGCVSKLIKYNKNIELLAVVDQEGIIYIFNSMGGELLDEFQVGCKTEVWALDYYFISRDAVFLYIGAASGMFYGLSLSIIDDESKIGCKIKPFWNQKTADMITKVKCYDINKCGKEELIISSLDKTLRVISYESGKYVWGQIFQSGITTFEICKFDDEEIFLAVGTGDGMFKIFNGENGGLISSIQLPNNIRTINHIKLPKTLFPEISGPISKDLFICGCDNGILYIINGIKGKILKEIQLNSYVWLSQIIHYQNRKEFQDILVTTYSFDFMSEILEDDDITESGIYLYSGETLERKWYIGDYNIQCISDHIIADKNTIIALGTTENKVIMLDVELGKLIYEITGEDIINSIILEKINDNLYIFYCDDKNNLICEKIVDI